MRKASVVHLLGFLFIFRFKKFISASELIDIDNLDCLNSENIDLYNNEYLNDDSVGLETENWRLDLLETTDECSKKRPCLDDEPGRNKQRKLSKLSYSARVQRSKRLFNDLAQHFQAQRRIHESFVFSNYEILNWPDHINPRKTIWNMTEITEIREKMKDFVYEPFRFNPKGSILIKREECFETIRKVFLAQNPNEFQFDLKHCKISKWPRNVPKNKDLWDIFACNKIVSVANNLVFTPFTRNIKGKVRPKEYFILNSIPIVKFNTLKNQNEARDILFERYKLETGLTKKGINWSLIDRSQIHEKYDKVPFNHISIRWKKFYGNPEIMDNIHFKHPVEDTSEA